MTPHPAETELKALKLALWRWSKAETYAEACKRWRALSELIGVDLAREEPELAKSASEVQS